MQCKATTTKNERTLQTARMQLGWEVYRHLVDHLAMNASAEPNSLRRGKEKMGDPTHKQGNRNEGQMSPPGGLRCNGIKQPKFSRKPTSFSAVHRKTTRKKPAAAITTGDGWRAGETAVRRRRLVMDYRRARSRVQKAVQVIKSNKVNDTFCYTNKSPLSAQLK